MTLAAPKSRQGKFILVLAAIAATIAVLGALNLVNNASATIPGGTTVTVTDDRTGVVPLGNTITHTKSLVLGATPAGPINNARLDWTTDENLFATAVSATGSEPAFATGDCDTMVDTYQKHRCANPGPLSNGVVTGTYILLPAASDATPYTVTSGGLTACVLGDAGGVTLNCTDQTDTRTIGPWDPLVNPLTASNPPNTEHVITFTLPAGVTCESDVDDGDNVRSCSPSDVILNDPPKSSMMLVDGTPDVKGQVLGSRGDVLVTITSAQETSGTITLLVKYDLGKVAGVTGEETVDLLDPVATKTFEFGIRHRGEADQATEDAANLDLDVFCTNYSSACGILDVQHDEDDATGSFHQACLINSDLTHADDGQFITWTIDPGPGSNATVNPAPNGQKIGGPLDIPCVRWSSGGVGSQTIVASHNPVGGPATNYYFDNDVPLPLVKEWNTIDSTRIVAVTGYVGDDLTQNKGELAAWEERDCSYVPVDSGLCEDPDLDGLTLAQEASFIIQSPSGILISAPPRSFIDYTIGSHSDIGGIYDGPVDGAEQTYTISGDCGSVRLENPQNGAVIILTNDGGSTSATVLSSDKGVGFSFVPNNNGAVSTTVANADCGLSATICISITTEEDNLFRGPPIDDAPDEVICVIYTTHPPTSKTPQLAWAGQRMVVEHFWGHIDESGDMVCPYATDTTTDNPGGSFYVLYSVQAGTGSFTAALQMNPLAVSQNGQDAIVEVYPVPIDMNNDGEVDPNSGCISRIIFENQDQDQNDIIAYVVDGPDLSNATPISQQVAFVIYYMKFEDAVLTLVPGSRANHNSGGFYPNSPLDSSEDVTEMLLPDDAVNVSADVLVRLRVRGWVETTYCPARDSAVGANGEFLPANRCIFPDDWQFKAGGVVGDGLNEAADDTASDAGFAESSRPNFDILGVVPTAPTNQAVCNAVPRASGPFSWLDTNVQGDTSAAPCGDSLAPNVSTASANDCLHAGAQTDRTCREMVFPNGIINAWDPHMPAALAMFMLHDDGFLRPADKDSIYSSGNLFYTTHIPAEPGIAPINNDLSGYQWNSWGGPGAKAGQYEFWTSLADSSAEVLSCAGPSSGAYYVPAGGSDPCGDGSGVRTGGYSWTKVYTDNHGEAMTWVNGDANLGFSECDSSAGGTDPDHMIVLLSGYYCENGDKVGHSTIRASVDYPDKRKHFAIMSNEVDIDWTWGGIKEVTIEPGENAQFNYVVFHVTDRDGYCGNSPSLHPVLGKRVNFVIDSPNGIIFPNADGYPAALLGTWGGRLAAIYTFDTADSALTITPTLSDDECQAWIHITESLLQPVNVLVIAYDPEGTVTFDKIVNAPTPTPEPPSPTPANQQNLWADIDCDNNVNPVDSLKILRADAGLSVSQSANCPTPGGDLNVQWGGLSTNEKWADADCSGGLDPADSLKILRSDAGLFYIQQEPCPDIGAEVLIPQQ
jgi:hypothetical protein